MVVPICSSDYFNINGLPYTEECTHFLQQRLVNTGIADSAITAT